MRTLEFRILGPLEVAVNGRQLSLGPRRRLLLAVLLTEVGRVIPVSRLVELMWGSPPPRSAEATLRTHVARMRRGLDSDGTNAALGTESGGYILNVGPDQVDALRFQQLVDEARRALQTDDPGKALALLDDALGLWRGPAWADIADGLVVVDDAARLESLRRSARGARAEALLMLGRHVETVTELESLLMVDPYDEDLRRLLAIALYRSRGVEAAARVCRNGIQLLVEQGLNSPQLQKLHGDVLRHAPYLMAERVAAIETSAHRPIPASRGLSADLGRRVPQEIPRDIGDFVGRERDLTRLESLLTEHHGPGPAIVVVDGAAGTGKSALVIRLAHQLHGRFPDGQLFVDLQGTDGDREPLRPVGALWRFVGALGGFADRRPVDPGEAGGLFRSLVAERKALIVIDDAADAAQIRPLLPGSTSSAVVVTSRRAMTTLEGTRHHHLGLLTDGEAVALLGRLAGARRVDAEPDQALRIARVCAGLMLAVRVAGARLAARPRWPLRTFADRLAVEAQRLDELQVEDMSVRACLAASLRGLRADPQATRVFRLLGLRRWPDLSVPLVAALADLRSSAAEAALERLADARLLESTAPGRYDMHDLVRLFAQEEVVRHLSEVERRAALQRAPIPTYRRQPRERPVERTTGAGTAGLKGRYWPNRHTTTPSTRSSGM